MQEHQEPQHERRFFVHSRNLDAMSTIHEFDDGIAKEVNVGGVTDDEEYPHRRNSPINRQRS